MFRSKEYVYSLLYTTRPRDFGRFMLIGQFLERKSFDEDAVVLVPRALFTKLGMSNELFPNTLTLSSLLGGSKRQRKQCVVS
jgi:hypothetical protein